MSGITPTINSQDGNIGPTNIIQVWGWNTTEAIGWDMNTAISMFPYITSGSINETVDGIDGSINPT